MIIVGTDPSLTATGVAIIDTDEAIVDVGTIRSKGGAKDGLAHRRTRLTRLADQITYVAGIGADLIVIEQPAYSRTVGHMHDRSGLWWLTVTALMNAAPVVEVSPSARARYATGRGNASKDEVLLAVARRFPGVEVTNNNEADALILAAMGADALGDPIATMPAIHREALAKVAWPQGSTLEASLASGAHPAERPGVSEHTPMNPTPERNPS